MMMTKRDREMLVNPSRFRADAIELRYLGRPAETLSSQRLTAENVRMGINLR